MKPSRELWQSMVVAASADVAYLAAAAAMKVHLAAAAFVPSLDLLLASLTEATFTGGAAKLAGAGVQQVQFDVATGFQMIQILEPAGGWTWECTADPPAPETIYGWYLTDNASAVLLGSGLLDAPLTIDGAGDALTVARITLSFAETSPF